MHFIANMDPAPNQRETFWKESAPAGELPMKAVVARLMAAGDEPAKRQLLGLFVGSLIAATAVLAQQNPSPSPTPQALTAEQKAAREKRLAERRAGMAKRAAEREARAAKHTAERKASMAKRAEELKATRAKRAEERKESMAKREAERSARTGKQSAERGAAEAKRKAAREAAAARRAATIEERKVSDGTFRFLSSRMNAHFTKVVTGAPYSALAVTEFVQKFVDGNQIIRRNEASYYRDSQGRTRVEQKLNTIGKWSASGEAPRIVMIGDPVSGEYYSLDPRTRRAVKNTGLGKRLVEERLKRERETAQPEQKPEQRSETTFRVSTDGRRKTEYLSPQTIEGVRAEGKRTTTTIPAGEIGNTLPIEITDESWFSPELQAVLMTKHHDPRSGDTVYRLTNINRRDPDRSLFQVPTDYTIVDKTAPKPAPSKKTEQEKKSTSQILD